MCAGLSQRHADDCLEMRAKESCRSEDRLIAKGPPKVEELSLGIEEQSEVRVYFLFSKWCEDTEIMICFISSLKGFIQVSPAVHVCEWQCLCV